MEQSKRRKIEMIAGLVLVVLAFLGNCHALMNPPNGQKGITLIVLIFTTIALVFAGIYIGTEFKKSSAKLYKLFLYAFALKELLSSLLFIDFNATPFIIIPSLIVFILVNILLWVDDLGKMKSVVLSGIVFVCELYPFIYLSFIAPPVSTANVSFNLSGALIGFAQISLSFVLVMMVHLKYVDKKLRKAGK